MLSLLSLYVFSFFLEQKKLPTVVYLFVFGFLGVVEESNNNVALAGGGSGGLYCGLVSLFLKKTMKPETEDIVNLRSHFSRCVPILTSDDSESTPHVFSKFDFIF
jgi:hypothetical protein